MLQEKRVRLQIDKVRSAWLDRPLDEGTVEAFEIAPDVLTGAEPIFGAPYVLAAMVHDARWRLIGAPKTVEERKLALSFFASVSLMFEQVEFATYKSGIRTMASVDFHYTLGTTVPILQSVGWIDQASQIVHNLWHDYTMNPPVKLDVQVGLPRPEQWVNPMANPYIAHKQSWFTSLTTLADKTPMENLGYDPDMDSLGAHWMLAQVWDDPDPAKVRNALTAMREQNVAATFVKESESQPQYIVNHLLLLHDYDIRSVNMRRKLMGLPVVEVEDYIYDMDLPLEVLPFAKDDVFYPAYVKMCAELGVEPYVPDNSIDVRVDPQTLAVTRV